MKYELIWGIHREVTRVHLHVRAQSAPPCSIGLRHTYIVRVYQELTFIHLSKCIQDSETHLIFQNKALLYQQCIQVSSDLRHTNIFRVYQKLTYIHVSAYIQGSKTQFIFQSMAVLYHQFIHVSKYPAI